VKRTATRIGAWAVAGAGLQGLWETDAGDRGFPFASAAALDDWMGPFRLTQALPSGG